MTLVGIRIYHYFKYLKRPMIKWLTLGSLNRLTILFHYNTSSKNEKMIWITMNRNNIFLLIVNRLSEIEDSEVLDFFLLTLRVYVFVVCNLGYFLGFQPNIGVVKLRNLIKHSRMKSSTFYISLWKIYISSKNNYWQNVWQGHSIQYAVQVLIN